MSYPIVEVEWVDHSEDSNQWGPIEEAKEWTLSPYKSVGYLIAEHEDRITLMSCVSSEGHDQGCGVMCLSRAMIKNITILKAEDTKE